MIAMIATLFEYTKYEYMICDNERFSEEENKIYLSEKTLNELDKLNEEKNFLEIGRKIIKPLNYVGVVKTGDVTIQIFPKFYRDKPKSVIASNILKMLSFTEILKIKEIEFGDLRTRELEDFFEIFILIFAKNLLKTLKSTQNLEYIRRKDELRFIKERINIKRYNNPARRHIIPCIFHERSADNLINRTLKYTAHLMSRIVKSNDNFKLLKSILNTLDPVQLAPITLDKVESITFSRLNKVFKPFIDICKVFLKNSTLTIQASEIETFSLLIPMERLFEGFIAGVIMKKRIFDFDVSIAVQKRIGYLTRREDGYGAFSLKPDIVIINGSKKYILDTKYKLLDTEARNLGVSEQDIYQMHAYATKLDADKVLLLYPDLNAMLEKYYFDLPNKKRIVLFLKTINLSFDLCSDEGWMDFIEELKTLNCLVKN